MGNKLGCVVMAAGNASRFGSNKLEAEYHGQTLIAHALDCIPAQEVNATVVVTQYSSVMRLASSYHFPVIFNRHPEYGISHTISMGITALRDCDGILFMTSDQPLLRRSSVAELANRWKKQPQLLAALSHSGSIGNPCIFPSCLFPQLMRLQGDRGGKSLLLEHMQDLILVEVSAAELKDADTPESLHALETL